MALEKTLLSVQKPFTYLGNEINVVRKNLDTRTIKFALGYPDLYELGMSNLGLRILYATLNGIEDVACERFFMPGNDMADILRNSGIPLFTLESKKALADFDFVGFSLSSELNYTNFLEILSLSGIPLRSEERKEKDPLVIAGGSCSLNPEPLSDFIDLWVIGEAEEIILEIAETYRETRGLKRHEILEVLAAIPGVYVPSIPRPLIEKRVVRDFENSLFPVKWLVPLCEIVHDRISVEIMRGCPQNCLFCQGGFCWKPARTRSVKRIIDITKEAYSNTGYEEISLLSFSFCRPS